MLRVAISSYIIYRFRTVWSNAPGLCFISYRGDTGSPDEVLILVVWTALTISCNVFLIISALVVVIKAISCQSDISSKPEGEGEVRRG